MDKIFKSIPRSVINCKRYNLLPKHKADMLNMHEKVKCPKEEVEKRGSPWSSIRKTKRKVQAITVLKNTILKMVD